MTPNPSKRMRLSAFNGAGAAAANPSPSTSISPPTAPHPNLALDDSDFEQQAAGEEKKQLAQRLYNQWRFLQDQHQAEEDMKAWLEAQGLSYDDHLRPPSPTATTMSRQTSRTSSVVGGGEGEDDHPPASRRRVNRGGTRGGRKGPLAKVAAAKAAYMRVSKKTCDECRRRKVPCTPAPGHYSLDEEEEAYQAWKASQALPGRPDTGSSPDPNLAFPGGFQNWMLPGQTQPTELLGVGVGDGQLPPSPFEVHGRYEDPDQLLSISRLDGTLPPSAHTFHARQSRPPVPHLTSSLLVRPGFDYRLESVSPSSPSDLPERDIPIGKELQDPAAIWQCQYGSEGTHSGTSLTSGSSEVCQRVFSDVNSLRSHYSWDHFFFGEYDNPYLSKCLQCGWYDSCPPPRDCVNCDTRNTTWEKWYRGWTVGSPSLPSEHRIAISKYPSQFPSSPAGPSFQPPGKGSTGSSHSVFQFFGNAAGTYQNTQYQRCCPMRGLLASRMSAKLGEASVPSSNNNNLDHEKGQAGRNVAGELGAVSSWTRYRGLSILGLPSRLSILILVFVLLLQLLRMSGLPWMSNVGLLDRGPAWEPPAQAASSSVQKDSRCGCRGALQRELKHHHNHGSHGGWHKHDVHKFGSQTAATINRSNHSCRRQQRVWTY